jgi:hypothetical protein
MEENEKYSHGHVNIGEQKVCGKAEKVVENVGVMAVCQKSLTRLRAECKVSTT